MALTEMTFVPGLAQLTDTRLPDVRAVCGDASDPKLHSYPTIVEVLPETVAVTITVSPTPGLLGAAFTITDGGCAGRTVTPVLTVSENPLASIAVAVTT